MSITSIIINHKFKKSDKKRDKGLKTPSDIKRYDNHTYGKYGKWNLFDIYLLKETERKRPTIINIHGGGWVYGTKETYQFYLMSLAQRGFVVINPNYRLAPKGKFPAQLEDINSVVTWALENHEDYFIDTNNIFLVGDSAGAHLTALYSSLCTNKQYRDMHKINPPKDFVPSALLLNCGVYKVASPDKSKTNSAILKDFLGKDNFDNKLNLIDPLKYITKDFPPVFLMSATGDFLLDNVEPMRKVLEDNEVEHIVKIYGDDVIKPPHVFQCDIRTDIADACNNDQCVFLEKYTK